MRLLICAGGTGGGVYPALAVHDVLTSKVSDVKTLWVGGEGGIEESLVKRHGIPFQSIPAAGVHGVSPLVLPRNLFMLARGVLASLASSMTSSLMSSSLPVVMWLPPWHLPGARSHPCCMSPISSRVWRSNRSPASWTSLQ